MFFFLILWQLCIQFCKFSNYNGNYVISFVSLANIMALISLLICLEIELLYFVDNYVLKNIFDYKRIYQWLLFFYKMKYLFQQRWRTTCSCRHKALLSSRGPDSIEKDSRSARRANRIRQRQARLHTVGLWWPRAGGPTASLCAEFGRKPAYSAVSKSRELG